MDVLSEVLRVIRLSGAVHFCAEFSRPWAAISSVPELLATRHRPDAACIIPFHVVTRGHCMISCSQLPPIPLVAGDVIIFPRGDQHVMASDAGLVPVPTKEFYEPVAGEITVLRYGGGGEACCFICGYLHSDQRFDHLLQSMPAMVFVGSRNGAQIMESYGESFSNTAPIGLGQDALWWQAAMAHLISEAAAPGPGSQSTLARLSELLFVEVVR